MIAKSIKLCNRTAIQAARRLVPNYRVALALLVISLIYADARRAGASNVLLNGSFENTTSAIVPDTSNPAFGDTAAFAGLSDWTHVSDTGGGLADGDFGTSEPPYVLGNGSTIPYRAPTDGNTYARFDSGTWVLTQSISVGSPGEIALSYDVIRLRANNHSGTLTFQLELFDGANDAAPSLYDVTTNVQGLTQEVWTEITSSGTLNSTGTNLFIRITGSDNVNGSLGGVDNIVLDYVAIPEPPTVLLAVIGLAAIGLVVRRKRLRQS